MSQRLNIRLTYAYYMQYYIRLTYASRRLSMLYVCDKGGLRCDLVLRGRRQITDSKTVVKGPVYKI